MNIGLAIQKTIRTLLLTLCEFVYSMIVFFFNVFEAIGTAEIVKDTYIMDVYERVGLILGLFMIFRITFSTIQYVINPDLLSDKKTGFGNVIKKAFLVVVLLGTTPYIFDAAFEIQNMVIEKNVLPKLIVGATGDVDDFGINLAEFTFFNFYKVNENATSDVCTETDYNVIRTVFHNTGDLSATKNCIEKYDETNKEWAIDFDYHGLLPLIVGVLILWIIIMYTIQVAVRAFQLAYLQLIAPIPIMLYLDPKKDDQLMKWGKQCLTTYLDLFIRVGIIYFVVFLIEMITAKDFLNGIYVSGGFFPNFYVQLILVIALLIFAKKVPDLFKELFPMSGGAAKFSMGLNPKKELNNTWAAAAIGAGVGAVGAGASNLIHGGIKMRNAWRENGVDKRLTKEQRESMGEEQVALYNQRRRAQMVDRFKAVGGSTVKTAFSTVGGVVGGAKAGLETKDISKTGNAVKTTNANREKRELKANAGYHWYTPTVGDKILGFSGETTSAEAKIKTAEFRKDALQQSKSIQWQNFAEKNQADIAGGTIDLSLLRSMQKFEENGVEVWKGISSTGVERTFKFDKNRNSFVSNDKDKNGNLLGNIDVKEQVDIVLSSASIDKQIKGQGKIIKGLQTANKDAKK